MKKKKPATGQLLMLWTQQKRRLKRFKPSWSPPPSTGTRTHPLPPPPERWLFIAALLMAPASMDVDHCCAERRGKPRQGTHQLSFERQPNTNTLFFFDIMILRLFPATSYWLYNTSTYSVEVLYGGIQNTIEIIITSERHELNKKRVDCPSVFTHRTPHKVCWCVWFRLECHILSCFLPLSFTLPANHAQHKWSRREVAGTWKGVFLLRTTNRCCTHIHKLLLFFKRASPFSRAKEKSYVSYVC